MPPAKAAAQYLRTASMTDYKQKELTSTGAGKNGAELLLHFLQPGHKLQKRLKIGPLGQPRMDGAAGCQHPRKAADVGGNETGVTQSVARALEDLCRFRSQCRLLERKGHFRRGGSELQPADALQHSPWRAAA